MSDICISELARKGMRERAFEPVCERVRDGVRQLANYRVSNR